MGNDPLLNYIFTEDFHGFSRTFFVSQLKTPQATGSPFVKTLNRFDIIHVGRGYFKIKILDFSNTIFQSRQKDEYGDIVEVDQKNIKYSYWAVEDMNHDGTVKRTAYQDIFDCGKVYWALFYQSSVLFDEFEDIDNFKDETGKVKFNKKWNFINLPIDKQVSKTFHYLDYPFNSTGNFLAADRYFLIRIKFPNGYTIICTTDFNKNKTSSDEKAEAVLVFEKQLEFIEQRMKLAPFVNHLLSEVGLEVGIEETKSLDLYKLVEREEELLVGLIPPPNSFLKRLGVSGIYRTLKTSLHIVTIESNFFVTPIDKNGKKKLVRHCGFTCLANGVIYSYHFTQFRLMTDGGEFIGTDYYHEIFVNESRDEIVVGKSFFCVQDEDSKPYSSDEQECKYLIDTSINEVEFNGTIHLLGEYSRQYELDSLPTLKYGIVNLKGELIVECKYQLHELPSIERKQ